MMVQHFEFSDNITIGDKNVCFYCGKRCNTTADHFFPKCRGGKLKVRCCLECNLNKGNRIPEAWIIHNLNKLKNTENEQEIIKYEKIINATQALLDKIILNHEY
jgi:hypothetical protein